MTIPGVGPVVALTYRATVPLQKRQGGRGGVRTDTLKTSIGRERPPSGCTRAMTAL
jgi:hypothetical protein